jgi:hypothetical protein
MQCTFAAFAGSLRSLLLPTALESAPGDPTLELYEVKTRFHLLHNKFTLVPLQRGARDSALPDHGGALHVGIKLTHNP